MGWETSKLLSYQPIKKPNYLLWGMSLLFLILAGFIITVFTCDGSDYLLFWFLAIGVPFFLWIMILASCLLINISEHAYNERITELNQESTQFWQNWSKQQIPIFGSYMICAEQNGIKALTGDLEQIPLYPEKARPLFNLTASTKPYWFLDEVMQNLEQQCPNYRRYLTHIYIPKALIDDDELLEAIFQRWDLYPEPIMDYSVWMSILYEEPDNIELSLILVCQYSDITYHHHSKFISAMLIGAESLINTKKLQAKSWLGRLMIAQDDLSADINQFFTYTQLSAQNVKDVWISGLDPKNRTQFNIERHKLDIGENKENLIHDIDLTFAKPTELTKYLALTMASGCVSASSQEQLVISQYKDKVYIQLITLKKLIQE
ncbi:hypothetical protein [Gilliamella bombi]|uniref:hypothetical protein n=1 Tax=Gilliamella bombi TaxID=1908521 RepID=UPI000A14D95B|nr:hypothetical protein [Gilliamella bombi]